MDFLLGVANVLPLLISGLLITLTICGLGLLVAIAFALPLVGASRSRNAWTRRAAAAWVALIRGLPMVILVFLMYFGLPAAFNLGRVSPFLVGVIALGMNGGAFISEVLRASIDRVPKGQWEAAESLGLNRWIIWYKVIAPQAMRIALPALVGELSFLVKASPVLSLITVVDLTRKSQQIAMQTFDPLTPMLGAALLYFIVLYSMSWLSSVMERTLAVVDHRA